MTVGDAKTKFVADYEGRIALQGTRAIKQRTFRQTKKMLGLALGALDAATPVADMDYAKVKAMVDYWQAKERGISERTSNNYLRAFKQFLEELPRIESSYPKPDIADLFTLRKVKGTIAKYDAKQIRTLLHALDDRCKLFQLLAINCGFYQVDICNLRADEIVTIKDETYIVRKRDKSSHQNDFTSQWWLFPETVTLLKQFRAPDNAARLALLRPNGKPLSAGGTSNDHVSLQWQRVREAKAESVKGFSFKQFRKIGVSAIKRITGNPDVARQYAAQVIDGSLADYDRDDFFDPLTAALKKWHEELTRGSTSFPGSPMSDGLSHSLAGWLDTTLVSFPA